MNYKLPFTAKRISELAGADMVLGHREGNMVGGLENASFDNTELEDGQIYILDDRDTRTHLINSIEIENGTVFLGGDVMGKIGRSGNIRLVAYERKELGPDFMVAVSSHVDYEEKTLPRLIRSLDREGVPEDRVIVFVAGVQPWEPMRSQERGYVRVPVAENHMGCTALNSLLKDEELKFEYVMLLHDTCEVMPGFVETVSKVDVGLPYDIICGHREIGLWSKSFIERLKKMDGLNFDAIPGYEIFKLVSELSKLQRRCPEPTYLRSKDVYGGGNKRQVMEVADLGVKKYVGMKKTGGRP
jgi:hypothetical protein